MKNSRHINSDSEMSTLLFLSFYESNYSRSATIFNFPDKKVDKSFFQVPTGFRMISYLGILSFKLKKSKKTYVVMSPSHLIAIVLRFFTTNKIVLDAGWPLLDGQKFSKIGLRAKLTRIKLWCIDFLSFHLADLVFLESQAQVNYSQRRYFLRGRNLEVGWTGLNESVYHEKLQETKTYFDSSETKSYIFFRGKVNEEAGLENIINAYRNHRIDAPLLILTNRSIDGIDENLTIQIISEYVTASDMTKLYKGALICLGQISSHPRLERTIPHKAFEAGFHGTPYISMRTKAILEVFPGKNQAIFLENDSPKHIAETINNILHDQELMSKYSEGIGLRYQNYLSQAKIHSKFMYSLKLRGII